MSADHLVIASLTFNDSPVSDGNAPHIVIYYLATNVFSASKYTAAIFACNRYFCSHHFGVWYFYRLPFKYATMSHCHLLFCFGIWYFILSELLTHWVFAQFLWLVFVKFWNNLTMPLIVNLLWHSWVIIQPIIWLGNRNRIIY